MNAYRISTGARLEKGDAISARRNGRWERAFFQRVVDVDLPEGGYVNTVHHRIFSGDMAVIFEGATDESFVRPHGAHDVMVRRAR